LNEGEHTNQKGESEASRAGKICLVNRPVVNTGDHLTAKVNKHFNLTSRWLFREPAVLVREPVTWTGASSAAERPAKFLSFASACLAGEPSGGLKKFSVNISGIY